VEYLDALEWLYNVRRFGPHRTLEPTFKILELLGNPQNSFKSIHVGGTNGKGSTSTIIASILEAARYKVGLYTSPHLEEFNERVKINGAMISDADVARQLTHIKPLFEEMLELPNPMPLRFFDIVTAMAFKYFEEQDVDFAVLEVGLGGRLDATTTVDPLVSVITNIGYEHVNILGPTLVDIAGEKAGIIKPNRILVTATDNESVFEVFKRKADSLNCRVIRVGYDTSYKKLGSNLTHQNLRLESLNGVYENLEIPLLGDYQVINAATAVATIEALKYYNIKIGKKSIKGGLSKVYWPGRLEIINTNPLVVLDCAKDAEATEAVRISIEKDFTYDKLISVVSMSSDKNIPGMMRNICQISDYLIITKHSVMNRAADPERLVAEIRKYGKPYEVIIEGEKAFARALELANAEDMVLIIGSVFLAGEARSYLSRIL
jgi:dihydrofolate synthase/folylpolyglutamate synthase